MSQKLKVELQDENGNIYYLHTAADVVFLDDGTTVEAALEKKVNASGGDISNTKLATLAAESASFPVPAAGDAPKTLWGKAKKWQQDCLAKFANYVLTSAITNQYLNDTSKIPTAALMYLLKQEVNGLNSDLDNNLARAALSYNLLAPCDRPTFLQWNSETLNTPYKAGLTSGSYGFAFVYGKYTTQMVLFAMALGTYEIFVCTVNNGQSSTWKKINPDFYMKINPEPTTLRGAETGERVLFSYYNSETLYLRGYKNNNDYIQLRLTESGLGIDKVINGVATNKQVVEFD